MKIKLKSKYLNLRELYFFQIFGHHLAFYTANELNLPTVQMKVFFNLIDIGHKYITDLGRVLTLSRATFQILS